MKPKYDGEDGTQEFIVKLTPIIVPITPEKPLVPGKEIPELPETPKYPNPKDPDGKTKEDLYKLTEEVKRKVTYYTEDKDGNNRTPIAESEIPTKEDTLNFRREGSINLVTGETTLGDWKLVEAGKDYTTAGEETGSFKDYKNPVKEGYLVVKEDVNGTESEDANAIKETGAHENVKATDADIEDKVIYRPIAKYVPKFPPGETPENPWNEVPYTNDPEDPTKITPPTDPKQPPIPYVPGMEPKDPGTDEPLKPVDPTDPKKGYIPPSPTTPFKDTEIPYEVIKGTVIVRHVIEGTETDLKDPETVKNNVKVGESYTTAGENELVGKDGKTYVLVGHRSNSDAATGEVEKGTKTVVYEYKLKEETPEVKEDKAVVIFRHVNADGTVVVKELERTTEFSGKEGEAIGYTATEKQAVIDKYRAQGFRVVADQYGTGKNYDGKDGVDTYYIDLTPYIVPVTPDKPLVPGNEVPTDPNSPEDPDPNDPKFPNPNIPTHPKDPKYPNPKDPNGGKAKDMYKLTEEVNRTITYYAIIDGVKTAIPTVIPTSVDTVHFQRKGTINLVTGDTTLENWNPQTDKFNKVTPSTTIIINGVEYTTTTVVNGEIVNPTDADKFYEVIYTPVVKPEVPEVPTTPEVPEKPETPTTPTTPPQAELPNTGVASSGAIFSAAVAAVIAGLGLAIPGKKKEEQ